MNRRAAWSALLALSFVLGLAPDPAETSEGSPQAQSEFGAPLTLEEPTPLAQILAAPERFADTPVLLRGKLVDVCQKKGCWTVLQEGHAAVRVRFRDYGFFLPRDATGRAALVEGVASVRELSQREARHLEAESLDGDPEAVHGPQREIGFVASGVRLIPAGAP